MAGLFKGTDGMGKIEDIYKEMEANCPDPCSTSKKLWELRHKLDIDDGNSDAETLLEKAVAMLAERGHMPGWFHQCPTASGITDSSISRQKSKAVNKKRNVDLVHWHEANKCARLIELKWGSDDILSALRQILGYGAAYIFCRVHKNQLPLNNRYVMDARHVSLEVVAPARYFGYNLQDRIAQMSTSLNKFAGSKTGGTLSMSLDAFAFPKGFAIPFANGREVKAKCNTPNLTADGQKVCDAFNNLTQVWP